MRVAKTIDQLYQEAREYDYVITCDAALATALNARVDDYKLGGFAYTPKLLAGILGPAILGAQPMSDLEIIASLEKDTGADFRYIHSEVQNIRDIRRYTADVTKFLHSRKAREIYGYFDALPTSQKLMGIYDPTIYRSFLDGSRVAVIGLDLFDDLDKHMLPLDFDEIDPFTDGDYTIDTIHAIGNDRQIAGSIADLITIERCMDTAIVFDTRAPVSDAIRSALYRRGIPFKNSLDVKDLSQVRDFLQFLELGLDYGTVRSGDARELISVYQTGHNSNRYAELRPEHDRYLLSKVPFEKEVEPVTARILGAMEHIRDLTFGSAMDILFDDSPRKSSVEILLKDMGIHGERVSIKLVNRLAYAVNNIEDLKHNEEVPEYEKKGVLMVDCNNSVYIDRPFVIFVGMDESWEPSAAGKDYVDKNKLSEDNAYRLSIMLQQGTTRIYAVKPVTKGKETVPCPTFQTINALLGNPSEVSCFSDICRNYVVGSWFRSVPRERVARGAFDMELGSEDWKFSKSSYNAYSDCPLKYMFSKLITTEDNEYTVFGNCLHEFAEFYLCYPDIVRSRGLDHYLSRLDTMYAGMSSECQRNLDVSRFRVYMNNLMRYIDLVRPEKVPLDMGLDERHTNVFMEEEGLAACSSLAEGTLSSAAPLFARYDMLNGSLIVDYKTGKTKEAGDIVKGFTRRGKGLSEFQALIYLQALSEHTSARPCRFNLLFLGDNDIASVDEDFDIRRNVRSVVLSDSTLSEIAFGPDGILVGVLGQYVKYEDILSRWDTVSPVLIDLAAGGEFDVESNIPMFMSLLGYKNTKTNISTVSGFLKKALEMVRNPYLQDQEGNVVVPADTMKAFTAQLTEDHATQLRERAVPIYDLKKGYMACRKCSYYKVCMKAGIADEEEEGEE